MITVKMQELTALVGVYCVIYLNIFVCGIVCADGDIRLQGGNSVSGRVEICNRNVWGTVCDDFWGVLDAQIACVQLGFNSQGE